MTTKKLVRTRGDLEQAADSLARAIERLARRNEEMCSYLESSKPRVAPRVATGLDDATERARRYWDKLEGRRSSPPESHAENQKESCTTRKARPSRE